MTALADADRLADLLFAWGSEYHITIEHGRWLASHLVEPRPSLLMSAPNADALADMLRRDHDDRVFARTCELLAVLGH